MGRETGENKVGGAAGRRSAVARRVPMTCRCAGEGRQNLTLHDAFSSAILTDWRRSHRIDRLDGGGRGDGGVCRLDWLNGLPAR